MSFSVSSSIRPFQPLSRAEQLGLVLSLSTSIPAFAGPRSFVGERRSAFIEQEAEAFSKLNRQQRDRYFEDLRALQRRRFDQSQEDIPSFEECLNRTVNAGECFERRDRQDNVGWRRELQALRQGYNLPVPPSHHHRPS